MNEAKRRTTSGKGDFMHHHAEQIRRNVAIIDEVRNASTIELALESLSTASANERKRRRNVRAAKTLEEAFEEMIEQRSPEEEQQHHQEHIGSNAHNDRHTIESTARIGRTRTADDEHQTGKSRLGTHQQTDGTTHHLTSREGL